MLIEAWGKIAKRGSTFMPIEKVSLSISSPGKLPRAIPDAVEHIALGARPQHNAESYVAFMFRSNPGWNAITEPNRTISIMPVNENADAEASEPKTCMSSERRQVSAVRDKPVHKYAKSPSYMSMARPARVLLHIESTPTDI